MKKKILPREQMSRLAYRIIYNSELNKYPKYIYQKNNFSVVPFKNVKFLEK